MSTNMKRNLLVLGLGILALIVQRPSARASALDVCYNDDQCYSACYSEVCNNQDPVDWACCAGDPNYCDCQCTDKDQPIGDCPPV